MQVMPISSQSNPTLECLPTELTILILFYIPDQPSLKSIVFSSPVFHQAYLAVRQPVLCSTLKTQCDSLLDLPEAVAAVRSEDTWRRQKEIAGIASIKSNQSGELHGLEETIKVFRLYDELNYFLKDYAQNAPRPTWIEPTQWRQEYLPLALSLVEKRRLLRALCRLRIFANIFGAPEMDLDLSSKDEYWNDESNMETEHEAYSLFYGTIPPWEYEEMSCVWSYLKTKYNPISKEISDDLRKLVSDTGCFLFWHILPEDQRPPNGCHMEIVKELDHFNGYFDLLASIGPRFLYRVLHAERLLRHNMVMANVRYLSNSIFIGSGLGLSWDYGLPLIYPADRHETPNFQMVWKTLPEIEQPNYGWKKAWLPSVITEQQELEEVLFYEHRSEEDWDWGDAIWDRERIEQWKAPILDDDPQQERPIWPSSPVWPKPEEWSLLVARPYLKLIIESTAQLHNLL